MIPGILNAHLVASAERALTKAIANGDIPAAASQPCSHCGTNQQRQPGVCIHWHHTDYHKPLEVVALCAKCHAMAHVESKTIKLAAMRHRQYDYRHGNEVRSLESYCAEYSAQWNGDTEAGGANGHTQQPETTQ